MTFRPLGNSDYFVASFSTEFSSNSKKDAPYHRMAFDYSHASWDGLRNHLRDLLWEDIFKLHASVTGTEF